MDFWIIRDGEKTGPFPDYEIRNKIEAGELAAADPAWCEGMEGWLPLEKIDAFASEFERPAAVPPPLTPLPAFPPGMPASRFPVWRRFWARWFDLHLYGAAVWGGMWAAGADLSAPLKNPLIAIAILLPWFLIEAALIHLFRTTPGKALLGISVTNTDETGLTLGQSLKRSMRVLISGIGMRFDLLCPLCMLVNHVIARKIRAALWDYSGGHVVRYTALVPWRMFLFVCVFMASSVFEVYVYLPAMVELMQPSAKDLQQLAPLLRSTT